MIVRSDIRSHLIGSFAIVALYLSSLSIIGCNDLPVQPTAKRMRTKPLALDCALYGTASNGCQPPWIPNDTQYSWLVLAEWASANSPYFQCQQLASAMSMMRDRTYFVYTPFTVNYPSGPVYNVPGDRHSPVGYQGEIHVSLGPYQ